MDYSAGTKTEEVRETLVVSEKEKSIVLYNDDYNTFDHVIDCLVDICDHNPFQAEQCAMIVHYKGKCGVKSGSLKKLHPLKSALSLKGLDAIIE